MLCPSMGPNNFGRLQSFWTGPIRFGQVQIIKISPEKSNLYLTKMIWTRPKQFVLVQNNLDGPKSFWTYRRTGKNTQSWNYKSYCLH